MNKAMNLTAFLLILFFASSSSLALASTVIIGSDSYTNSNHNILYGANGFINPSKSSSDSGANRINIVDYILENRLGINNIDNNTYTLLDSSAAFAGIWYGEGASSILINEIAGYKDTNEFGYYTIGSSNKPVITPLSVIFQGNDSAPDSDSFSLNSHQDFGFYLKVQKTNSYYYTESFRNNLNEIHAVVFQVNNSNQYIIGFEDLPLRNSDKDYQDMIVSVTVATPEPGTILLMGVGAIGAAFMKLRRRKAS